jgi:hypothetical protein
MAAGYRLHKLFSYHCNPPEKGKGSDLVAKPKRPRVFAYTSKLRIVIFRTGGESTQYVQANSVKMVTHGRSGQGKNTRRERLRNNRLGARR